jgi:hypothetical protein
VDYGKHCCQEFVDAVAGMAVDDVAAPQAGNDSSISTTISTRGGAQEAIPGSYAV